MALTVQKSAASLIQKTLQRQSAINRLKFKFSQNQIENVLLNYANKGIVGPYSELLKILQDYPLNDDNYKILFEESLSCIVLLGREYSQYVELVCTVEWASRSEELVQLFIKFVLSLVTAHTYHCPRVMRCLLKNFKAEGDNWEGVPPDDIIAKWSNVHTVIAQIVAIMPMTSDILMQSTIDRFPYYKAGCYVNRSYIHNLIWMSKYIPLLQEQIMTTIVTRMIEMDVNAGDCSNYKQQSEVFEIDIDEHDTVSETLDYCMMEVLKWLEDERDVAMNTMCNVFERVVLPTYGTRYVQFLLLYTISINQQCADRVLSNLWKVAAGLHGLGPGAIATRRTAASHLAGLLARCVRVPNTRLIHYLKLMAEWCHSYITATQESSTANDNNKFHGAFHSICHAIFYLIAFKNHHLFKSKENLSFVESLNLPRLVNCSLNPLRNCPPQVTHAFSSVTRAHQVAYCQAIIEKNARHTLQNTAVQEYDEWFPYDPYTLPISGKQIWPLCIEYSDWLQEGDDQTQYTSMKRKLEVDDDDYLIMEASPTQKLASSLSNSVSAGFRTSESIAI